MAQGGPAGRSVKPKRSLEVAQACEQREAEQGQRAEQESQRKGPEAAAARLLDHGRRRNRRHHQRTLALDQSPRDVIGDGIDERRGIVGFGDHDAAEAAVLHEAVDALVAPHHDMGDDIDPQPRRIALADAAVEQIDLFDRGISQGETPRLWIDVVAHVMMGRDKRIYRFVQDTRFGRTVIAESHDVEAIVGAVTDYVARRMIEREHALTATSVPAPPVVEEEKPRRRGRVWPFVLGFIFGALALFGLALFASLQTI